MRIPLCCALSTGLLLIVGCSRDAAPPGGADPAATPAAATTETPAPAASEQIFGPEELEQMVAPIALYPDPLLAQVLMGATYPGDVADAAAWAAAHPDAKGDAAVLQVANQPWDPSVQALVAFPEALSVLGQDPAWVQRLGDAFLAQPEAVMDAVQRLRHKAEAAGNLASNEYQSVFTQPAPPPAAGEAAPAESTVIVIEPSEPEVVYVPAYDPNTAYGAWSYPSYPPPYYPPSPYYYPGGALASGLMWGAGIAIAGSLWGDMDWNDNDINIDVDRYNNINRNNQINRGDNTWNHNAANRDGVPYRDQANRERNGRQLDGAGNRDAFRGEDARRTEQRNQARASMQDRGIQPASSNREARDQARTAANRPDSRDAARDRAGATADRSAQRDRAQQSTDRNRTANQGSRDGGRTQTQQQRSREQTQRNNQSRDTARQQQQRQQAPRNNAFEGASRPSSSHQAQQRGQSSRQSASRPSGSRSSGQPVSRPSSPPQRSSGGGRRR
ncbi:DUF3300 domain-containing protein [Arenimonas daejeonensis]|uniref:DUF3300 domain-containing protein n=1 Tax=Arenimonas daejeonensis TaxID=370777 RepID=UPI0011BE347B|nr:DUF3300 domain-containing protein [Arenimonas daejeonensis]